MFWDDHKEKVSFVIMHRAVMQNDAVVKERKPKGLEGLIEVNNPNLIKPTEKVSGHMLVCCFVRGGRIGWWIDTATYCVVLLC